MATSHSLDLPISSLEDVYLKLHQAKHKWLPLGKVLGVNPDRLSNYEDDFRGDLDLCLKEILYNCPVPLTWRRICQALRDPSVARNDLADEILKEMGDLQVESMDAQTLDTELTPNHLYQVYTKLKKVSINWLQMGSYLDVSQYSLDSIRQQHGESTYSCLYEMLAQRLKLPPPLTWSKLCECLRSQNVLRKDIAISIEKELIQKPMTGLHNDQKFGEQLYSDAIKKGCVSVKTSNVLLFGMAGTGKTSTKHLILGLSPPQTRTSTPVAEPAKPVFFREIRDVSGMIIQEAGKEWKQITSEKLVRLVVDTIKSYATKNSSIDSKELESKLEQISSHRNDPISDPHSSLSSTQVHTVSLDSEMVESDDGSSLFLKHISDINKDIQQMMNTDSPSEVIGSNWIYIIDSGGQPRFHNLLPHFVRTISVALYVFRLTDRLKNHPSTEYYKNGRRIGEPFKSHLSTEDNFKYLIQSIQSSHNKDCSMICIGTHLDEVDKCSESIEEKNTHLFKLLPESIVKKCHFEGGRIVIPINACAPDGSTDRSNYASKLHQVIEKCPFKEFQVPIWWYIFQLILKKTSKEEKRKVYSINNCKIIAKELNLDEDEIFGALEFFHSHHLFHYYSNVLPDVVFCDTQVLLDKVTELVEYAAYFPDSELRGGSVFHVRNRGIITIELLEGEEFTKHYVDGLFGPSELLQIFQHLLIATPLKSPDRSVTEYFIPSLLDILTSDNIEEVRNKLLDQNSTHLIIRFQNGWAPCGVFCCLQVYLIKECDWSVGKLLNYKKDKLKQNVAKYLLPDDPYNVTLIDTIEHIEVYVSSGHQKLISITPRVCSIVKNNILSGINSAYQVLNYNHEEPELAFFCPHTPSDAECGPPSSKRLKPDRHPAIIVGKSGFMRCTLSDYDENCYPLDEQNQMWISNESESGPQAVSHCEKIDYTKADCSKFYNTMVQCSVTLNHAMSKDPQSLAKALFNTGFISPSTLEETNELNETKSAKGSRLYSAVLERVRNFPNKFADFINALRQDRLQYGDVLTEIDTVYNSL